MNSLESATTPDGPPNLRPEIALSWKRSQIAGVSPGSHLESLEVIDFESSSRLIQAAAPVLDRVAFDLNGLPYSLLLGDSDSCIVGRWFDKPDVDRALERAGAVSGARWRESDAGTNGLGTPLEVRNGIWIRGGEHFARILSPFTCYGQPIVHPITHRLEGVLNITVRPEDAHPLFAPMLIRAAEDIQVRLLESSRASDTELFRAFQEAGRTGRTVIALNDNVVLASNAALGLVEESDVMMLRELASNRSVTPGGAARTISLASGAQLEAQIERLSGASNGAIIRLTPRRPAARAELLTGGTRYDVADDGGGRPAAAVASFRRIYVGGETGTGRTTTAHGLAQRRPVTSLDARDSLADGSERWARKLSGAAKELNGSLVVESVHVLAPELVEFVEGVLEAAPDKPIILTGHADKWLPPHMRGLLARCDHVVSLSPLLRRRSDIPALAASMLSAIDPDHDRRLSPAAARVLMAQPWPGNLSELKKVLRAAVSQRTFGSIEVGDLPQKYRSSPTPILSGREQAERDVIIDALRRFNGNKTHAAEHLGITRTTLYNRIRALKITDQTV